MNEHEPAETGATHGAGQDEGRGEGRGERGRGRGPRGRGFGPGFPGGFRGPGPGGRGRRGGPGGPFGRPGGWQQADLPPADDVPDWFAGRLPSEWFVGAPQVSTDREEIVVIGELPPMDGESASDAAADGRISRFREDSRDERVRIAQEAEHRYGRTVSWGASMGGRTALFTHLSIPVMTRLRQPQRQVLDTLVDAGVARSRSEALGWAVSLVGQHTEEWLQGLRDAMSEVDKLRTEGPQL
ncbi:MAG: hypothetical protein ACR2JN_05260 [Lapillicoccus sp.]